MIRDVLRDLRRTWPQLAITDALAALASVAVLSPAVALVMRVFLVTAENPALSDEEILVFFLRPLGLAMLVVVAALSASILLVEQAGLMVVGFGAVHDRAVSYLSALRHVARRAPRIAHLAGLVLVRLLAVAAPFLAAGAGVYALLLTEHDINYYLAYRPPELVRAAVLCGGLAIVLGAIVLRLTAGWLLALPSLLVTDVTAPAALAASVAATRGKRMRIVGWIVAWGGASALASVVVTLVLGLVSREITAGDRHLNVLVTRVAVVLALTAVANVVVGFVSRATLALLVVRLQEQLAPPSDVDEAVLRRSAPLGERPSFRVPKKGLVLGALGVVALVVALTVLAVRSLPVEDEVAVVAHRGGALAAPENTLAAIRRGIADGADWVEIDVQESKDGVVVVAHDKDFMRTSREPRKVWELTSAELADLDIGSWFDAAFAGEHVPTLAEVLATCKGRARVLIELKDYGQGVRLEQRVVDEVEAAGMRDEVAVMSLSLPMVENTNALRPDWGYGYLSAVSIGDLTRVPVDFLAVTTEHASRSFVRAAHARGREVWVWTVNSPAQMSALMSRGVDALITDDPGLVRRVLQQRAEMSPGERMLLELGATFGLLEEEEGSGEEDA